MKKLLRITLTAFYTTIIVLGFAMPLNLPNGTWQQQFMPNLNGRTISDIFFLDSTIGWAVTPFVNQFDTTFVLKTTNSGDNWFIQFTGTGQFVGRNTVYFINAATGFTCGNDHYTGSTKITKTTNGGNNWSSLTDPTTAVYNDLFVLNEDTIWVVSNSSLTGGVWRTTNAGATWDQQFSGGNQNPNRIYMYNARIGFMCNSSAASPNIYNTTNSGVNWNINLPGEYFFDIHFTDSLTGWKCVPGVIAGDSSVKKTTNGGANWFKQTLPSGGIITAPAMGKFAFINSDTIYGVGSAAFYGGGQFRGIIFRTINGGNNWLFQVPDTTIHIASYSYAEFVNGKTGWAYSQTSGVHTTNGGDTNWVLGVTQVSTEIPKDYKLYQNYPNPFNPKTNIKYSVKSQTSNVKLIVFDILGKKIAELVNQKQNAGTYEIDYSGNGLSSSVYFYRIEAVEPNGNKFVDSKKMVLLK